MFKLIKKMWSDKKAWRAMEARAKALPKDYQIVYSEIQNYMWQFSAGSGMDTIPIFEGVLELFESGAANGKKVLDVTGHDVASFCDELLRNVKTYTENWRKELNSNIAKKLGV